MLRRFITYYRPHMKLFLADLVCALLLSLCDLVSPLITRSMINDYIPNRILPMLIGCAAGLLIIYLIKLGLN